MQYVPSVGCYHPELPRLRNRPQLGGPFRRVNNGSPHPPQKRRAGLELFLELMGFISVIFVLHEVVILKE